jgi:hypothetical protein
MGRRKKLIKDSNLLDNYDSCLIEKIPLSPQSHQILLHIAEKRYAEDISTRTPKAEAFKLWKMTKNGKIAVRKAFDLASVRSSNEAHSWLFSQFLAENPQYKPVTGRPPSALNKKTRVLLKVGEIIAELLNRSGYEIQKT